MKSHCKRNGAIGEILVFFFFVITLFHFGPLPMSDAKHPDARKEIKASSNQFCVPAPNETLKNFTVRSFPFTVEELYFEKPGSAQINPDRIALKKAAFVRGKIRALIQFKSYQPQKVPDEPALFV